MLQDLILNNTDFLEDRNNHTLQVSQGESYCYNLSKTSKWPLFMVHLATDIRRVILYLLVSAMLLYVMVANLILLGDTLNRF